MKEHDVRIMGGPEAKAEAGAGGGQRTPDQGAYHPASEGLPIPQHAGTAWHLQKTRGLGPTLTLSHFPHSRKICTGRFFYVSRRFQRAASPQPMTQKKWEVRDKTRFVFQRGQTVLCGSLASDTVLISI